MIQSHARGWGRRIDRFQGRALAKPLLQQEGCGGTVETTAPVTCQSMALTRCPGAAVLVHPGQRQLQRCGEPQSIAAAVNGLSRWSPSGIKRQPNHQPPDQAGRAMGLQHLKITLEAATMQWRQRRHRDSERITSRQADAATANIKAEHGTGRLQGRQRRPRLGVGRGA